MRLQNYLLEKYYDSAGSTGAEIFINPSKRDFKEMDARYGYRFFIDFRKKNIYMFNSDTYHREVIGTSGKYYKLNKELNLNWESYWNGTADSIEYVIMGDCNMNMSNVNSDSLMELADSWYDRSLEKVQTLTTHDYNWLSKYGFNPKEVKGMVEEYLDTMMENKY